MSVSDAVGKRREIVVPGKAKPKDKEKEKALKGKPQVSLGLRGENSITVFIFPRETLVSCESEIIKLFSNLYSIFIFVLG